VVAAARNVDRAEIYNAGETPRERRPVQALLRVVDLGPGYLEQDAAKLVVDHLVVGVLGFATQTGEHVSEPDVPK
jgi:hypothetical protein